MYYIFREQNPRPFQSSGKSKKDDSLGMQRTNPSLVPDPGINDDLIFRKVRCDNDQEKYYDPRCFNFEGSGNSENFSEFTESPSFLVKGCLPLYVEFPPLKDWPCLDNYKYHFRIFAFADF